MRKILFISLLLISIVLVFCSCETQAQRATYNLEQEADNFNIHRQVTVINTIANDIMYNIVGKCSIEDEGKRLYVIVEYEKGKYKRIYAGLADNVSYIAEDLECTPVSPYHYEININPKMWIPALPDIKD